MIFMSRMILMAAALAVPAFAGDVDDVMATPSRAKAEVPSVEEQDGVADYLKSVHGEVSAMVGTGGTYGVSGTAVLPLGENGTAIVSFSTGREPGWLAPYGTRPYGVQPYDYYRQPMRR